MDDDIKRAIKSYENEHKHCRGFNNKRNELISEHSKGKKHWKSKKSSLRGWADSK